MNFGFTCEHTTREISFFF